MGKSPCLFSESLLPCDCHRPLLSTTELLNLALEKRKQSSKSRYNDYRKDILQKIWIKYLCKKLGEECANRKEKRRSNSTKKRHMNDNSLINEKKSILKNS